jgi:2'-5' RNA ligase
MVDPAARKRRLFVGIDLNQRARNACAATSEKLRQTGFDAKYEPPEKLHVTLAFLGLRRGRSRSAFRSTKLAPFRTSASRASSTLVPAIKARRFECSR